MVHWPPLPCHGGVSIPLLITAGLLWVISANKIAASPPSDDFGSDGLMEA